MTLPITLDEAIKDQSNIDAKLKKKLKALREKLFALLREELDQALKEQIKAVRDKQKAEGSLLSFYAK
jgi:hypothetical protein